ncbi:membrane dipeptidase [Parvibaculum indicum]|uniref:dipeptidase n=1 Tax=Parvibaculum indicum TaxID=562969 RepID=UPI00142335CC|nr:dipeptidase [Parvibaculum indicum]NIJ42215.1 membrane dipeptidase [Parvibaculum indicum]
MRGKSIGGLVLGAILLLGTSVSARADEDAALRARAHEIHDRVIAIDTHVDIPTSFATPAYDPGEDNPAPVLVDIPKMEKGGLDGVFFIVYVPQTERDPAGESAAISKAFAKFAAIHRMADNQNADRIGLATSAADVRRLNEEGKKVALIGIENGFVVDHHPELLDIYYELGARYFGLVHNGHNDLADSAQPKESLGDKPNDAGGEHQGLSPMGEAVVRRCNDLGIMVDISHSAKSTALDAIRLSRAPVIASHSSVHALRAHPRNMDDETMKAMAAKGGVIQIVAFDDYLHEVPKAKHKARGEAAKRLGLTSLEAFFDASEEAKAEFRKISDELDAEYPRSTLSDLIDHIDYAVTLVGIDHVGIASDFQGGGGIQGWRDAGETFNVTLELVRRGYGEEEIAKLWGGNILRVMDEVEAARKQGAKQVE